MTVLSIPLHIPMMQLNHLLTAELGHRGASSPSRWTRNATSWSSSMNGSHPSIALSSEYKTEMGS